MLKEKKKRNKKFKISEELIQQIMQVKCLPKGVLEQMNNLRRNGNTVVTSKMI